MRPGQLATYRWLLALTTLAAVFLAGARWGEGTGAHAQSVPAGKSAGGGTADSNGDMIAVTGASSSGAAILYLVDTRTRRVCVYQGTGKNIELVAARNIEFDMKLDMYRDTSDAEVQVPNLRAEWQKRAGANPGAGAPPK